MTTHLCDYTLTEQPALWAVDFHFSVQAKYDIRSCARSDHASVLGKVGWLSRDLISAEDHTERWRELKPYESAPENECSLNKLGRPEKDSSNGMRVRKAAKGDEPSLQAGY